MWNEDTERALRDLYARGRSYKEIARELGITKGAIAGRLYRLGLSRSVPTGKSITHEGAVAQVVNATGCAAVPVAVKKSVQANTKSARQKFESRVRKAQEAAKAKRAAAAAVIPQRAAAPEIQRHVRLIDAHFGYCRWPTSGDRASLIVCHAPAQPGSSYCADCYRLAYVPANERGRYEKALDSMAKFMGRGG
jgi:hypothetical protein